MFYGQVYGPHISVPARKTMNTFLILQLLLLVSYY